MICDMSQPVDGSSPRSRAGTNIMTPRIDSRDSGAQIAPRILSMRAASATKVMTLAVIMSTSFPAPRMESPRKKKNGSLARRKRWRIIG